MSKKKITNIVGMGIVLILSITLVVLIFINRSKKMQVDDAKNNSYHPEIVMNKYDVPKYVDGSNIKGNISSEDDMWNVLNELKDYYDFKDAKDVFNVLSIEENNDTKFYKVQQKYKNVAVYGNQLILAVDSKNKVLSVQGSYYPDINVSFPTKSSVKEIKDKYVESLKNKEVLFLNDGEKYYYILDDKIYAVYYFRIVDVNGIYDVFLDASTANLIDKINISTNTVYSYTGEGDNGVSYTVNLSEHILTAYEIYDEERKISIVDGSTLGMTFYDSDKSPDYSDALYYLLFKKTSMNPIKASMVNNQLVYNLIPYPSNTVLKSAITNLGTFSQIYDYYYKNFGRKSYDGKGTKFNVIINVKTTAFGKELWPNACWSAGYFVIGGKDGITYSAALDVVAHEYTHAVSGSIVDLVYKNQSGALNESYSDVIGSSIEGKNFILAEDIETVRDMGDPNRYKNPAIKGGNYYFPDDTEVYNDDWIDRMLEVDLNGITRETWKQYDNGGVHYNSGVPNYAAYLIYNNGAVSNFDELARLYYDSLFYLSSNADFEDAALAILSTAEKLNYSSDKIEIIKNAFIETKMLDGDITLSGNVTDDKDKNLESVKVTIAYKKNPNLYYVTYTDSNGNYKFENVCRGDYSVIFEKAKYASKDDEINLNEDKKVNASLAKIDEENYDDIDVVFVMDISYSMEKNDPNDIRKEIFVNILSSMDNNASASLITFAATSNVVRKLSNSVLDKKMMLTDVFNISNVDTHNENSGTNGRTGLNAALKQFSKGSKTRKYIIFLTDGQDNKDDENIPSYDEIIKEANKNKIRILSIGLSDAVEADVLKKLASETNGKYYFANSNSALSEYDRYIFDEIQ